MGKNYRRVNLHLITQTLLLVALLASCKKQTVSSAPNADSGSGELKGKPASGPSITYLKVTVNDAGNKFTSDGGGDYVNGSQAVSVKFDEYGNFIFSAGTIGHGPNATYPRWINVNFDSPIVVYITPPIGDNHLHGITTVPAAGSTFIPLQSLSLGQSECVGLTGGNDQWVANFHRATEDVSGSPSAYAVFTKTGANTWSVTPAGTCSSHSNVCALRLGPGTLYGYYNMPFSLTLTSL